MEAGSGWRGDGLTPSHPSVPLLPRPGPPQPLHHLLSGSQPAVPALHLPGALQVCVGQMTCTLQLWLCFSLTAAQLSPLLRLTPRNCPLLTNQSLPQSQPWFEMLVKIQEITRDLSGTRPLQHQLRPGRQTPDQRQHMKYSRNMTSDIKYISWMFVPLHHVLRSLSQRNKFSISLDFCGQRSKSL